jgi:hypothetical protein
MDESWNKGLAEMLADELKNVRGCKRVIRTFLLMPRRTPRRDQLNQSQGNDCGDGAVVPVHYTGNIIAWSGCE